MDPVLAAAAGLALARGTRMVEPGELESTCQARGSTTSSCCRAEEVRPDLDAVCERMAEAARAAVGQGAVDLAAHVGESALLVECILDQWVRWDGLLHPIAQQLAPRGLSTPPP